MLSPAHKRAQRPYHPYLHLIQVRRTTSFSAARSRIFPLFLRIAPDLCHSLIRRLAVYGVMIAESASSWFVISTSMPSDTFLPMLRVSDKSTLASRSRALREVRAAWALMY